MISRADIETITAAGGVLYSTDGDGIGPVRQVYLDAQTGYPALVRVSTRISAASESLVPLRAATMECRNVLVPYSKDQVREAPPIDAGGGITPEEQTGLFR